METIEDDLGEKKQIDEDHPRRKYTIHTSHKK